MAEISLDSLKVQLVEPSGMQTQLIEHMLEHLGVKQVHRFGDAASALAGMRQLQPDVVISSLYLPDMIGTKLVTMLRGEPGLEWTPFILISSETRPQALDPVRQAGACCILAKPFTTEQLKRALFAVIDQLAGPDLIDGAVEDLKVLVVDDSGMSRRYLRHLLEAMGIEPEHIVEANNGCEAIPILAETIFDLVLTDYNMPEMDGRALTEYIRTQSWQTEVPILMVTSEQNQGRLAGVEKAGVSAICDKPFDVESIREVIIRSLAG